MSPFRLMPVALAALTLLAAPAQAAEVKKFDRVSFEAAKAAGRPILVDVKAWWCPICGSQNRTIKAAIADPAYTKLVIFEINYDSQKPEWQALGVHKQGTLIGYKGKTEVGRVEFKTDKAVINGLLQSVVR
ncbi:MAG: thioredoxin family protein [Sphingomonas sp.]|nr:thioredoxin family protein [Sphingomonas sp.]